MWATGCAAPVPFELPITQTRKTLTNVLIMTWNTSLTEYAPWGPPTSTVYYSIFWETLYNDTYDYRQLLLILSMSWRTTFTESMHTNPGNSRVGGWARSEWTSHLLLLSMLFMYSISNCCSVVKTTMVPSAPIANCGQVDMCSCHSIITVWAVVIGSLLPSYYTMELLWLVVA